MQKTILFLFPFGRAMGVGHLVRQAVLGAAARQAGYRTILFSNGAFDEIPAVFQPEAKAGFDEVIAPTAVIDDKMKFPAASAVEALGAAVGDLAAVIIDDYRGVVKGVSHPERVQTIAALRALCDSQGAVLAMVDGVAGLEFDLVDKIINLEVGVDKASYPPAHLAKMLRSDKCQYALVRQAFFTPEPVPVALPERPFLISIGGTDPQNAAQSILEGLLGCGYNPVLVAGRTDKPEDAPRQEAWQKALAAYPDHAWLGTGFTAGQMHALQVAACFSVVAPGTSPCWEHFYTACPMIGVYTNPSLAANINALQQLGLPVVRPTNAEEMINGWQDPSLGVQVKFEPTTLKAAVGQLRDAGYLANRLPTDWRAMIDGKGGQRLLAALGL